MTSGSEDTAAELVRALTQTIPSQRVAEALQDGLDAMITERDGTVKPDHRVRVDCAKTLLLYRLGKPLERTETTVKGSARTEEDAAEAIRRSPALRAGLAGLLARLAEEDAEQVRRPRVKVIT